MAGSADLAGVRVLVVEDEMLVSLLIEDVLTESHCVVIGPFDQVPTALEAARTLALDVAVLDVNLAGTMVYPVAEMLSARGIPFLLLSGYGSEAIPPEHPTWTVCSKPFRPEHLIGMLGDQLAAQRAARLSG
jgi:CheY-like chemotaxis protein